jgi:hypothetical protein
VPGFRDRLREVLRIPERAKREAQGLTALAGPPRARILPWARGCGALWFTELFANGVGRITTKGRLSEYRVAGAGGITVGRDRQVYVDLFTGLAVARINLKGEVMGHWALSGVVGPLLITTGFGVDI